MEKNSQCPFSKLFEPEGPKGAPFIHSFFSVAWDVLGFLIKTRSQYGNIALYKLFGIRNYLVSNPDDIAEVFKDEKQGKYTKQRFHDAFSPLFGDGLFNSDGVTWGHQRKQLQPYFQKQKVATWFPIVAEESLNRLKLINNETEIKSEEDIQIIIQGIMCRVLFGVKPEHHEESKKAIKAIEYASQKLLDHALKSFLFKGFLNKLPTPGNKKYKEALITIDTSIYNMSADDNNNDTNALLPMFSKIMSPKELRDQLFTFYFAGQDTTKNAILWTLYNLSKHSDCQIKARDEVLSVWPNPSSINYDDLDKLIYVNAVIEESLRLYPPAYVIPRDIKEDMSFKNKFLKKGGVLVLSPYVTHRHPDYWNNPDDFYPERFINNKNRSKRLSFFPFGAGKRICIGKPLAEMEMTTVIALFVASFNFSLKSGASVKPAPFMTLKPKKGVPLNLTSTGYLGNKT